MERELLKSLDSVSLPQLQILLLLIYDRTASGHLTTAWYLTALAVRIAFGLRLNHRTQAVPFINQECRRRLMWCTFIMDKITSAPRAAYPPLCPREAIHISLPCNTHNFTLEVSCETPTLEDLTTSPRTLSDPNLGINAYLTRIIDIQDAITRYLSDGLDRSQSPWEGDVHMWQLHQAMNDFAECLPPDLRNSERALYSRMNTVEISSFVILQSRLHCCYTTLFGFFLSDAVDSLNLRPLADNFVTICITQTVRYAVSLNTFWRQFIDLSKTYSKTYAITDWTIASCVVENTNAILASYRARPTAFEDHIAVESALQANLEFLSSLAKISPYVSSHVSLLD